MAFKLELFAIVLWLLLTECTKIWLGLFFYFLSFSLSLLVEQCEWESTDIFSWMMRITLIIFSVGSFTRLATRIIIIYAWCERECSFHCSIVICKLNLKFSPKMSKEIKSSNRKQIFQMVQNKNSNWRNGTKMKQTHQMYISLKFISPNK